MILDVYAEQIRSARAVFLDWDGCLVQDGALLPGADRFLDQVGSRAWILSNNSTDFAQAFADLLGGKGVAFPTERILLAGELAVDLVANRWPGAKVHMVSASRMKAKARQQGLVVDVHGDEAEVVLLLRDTRFTYSRLTRAVCALRRGARLVVANTDRTHPAGKDGVVPETGALLAAIAACVDLSTIEVEVFGKPEPLLFQSALQRAGAQAHDAVMIGDNPETDVAGAERLGIPAICVSRAAGVTVGDLADALEQPLATSRGHAIR